LLTIKSMTRKSSVSEDQNRQCETDGFLMVRDLFEAEEMDLRFKISKSDTGKRGQIHAVRDTEGRKIKLWLASQPRRGTYTLSCGATAL